MRGLSPGLSAGFGLIPRPYDALLGVPPFAVAGFGLPGKGNDGVYGLALGSGLPKVPDTGVPA